MSNDEYGLHTRSGTNPEVLNEIRERQKELDDRQNQLMKKLRCFLVLGLIFVTIFLVVIIAVFIDIHSTREAGDDEIRAELENAKEELETTKKTQANIISASLSLRGNGSNSTQGNVYLFGQPICDNHYWNDSEATVSCRMLGYEKVIFYCLN